MADVFSTAAPELSDFPCAGALVAGTFALMTTWALPDAPGADATSHPQRHAQRQVLIARKIVSNLFFLQHHPALGEPLRRVMAHAHERWLPMARNAPAEPVQQQLAVASVFHSQVH
jgi:hypothetical protein